MNLQQLIKFGLENSQEPVIKNPVLREALVGTPTKEVTQFDKRIYETPEGERVSEKSTTFFLNGKWLNVPTIHNGRSFTEDQLRLMIKQGQIQPTSVHGSRNEAEEAAASRSNMMKSHVKGFDEGGQVIGKPGGLVEPGVEYYAKKKKKWEASVYKGEETQISKVRKYFDGLPKDSKIVIKDVGKELNMNRHTIDEILKEKKYKNKFKVLRTADYLDNTGFTMEYANFVDSDYFDTGADKEFAEFLNDKGFKNSKGGNFTSKGIYSRRLRGDIESGSIFKPRNEKEVLQEAKRLEIKNYKSLSPEKLREKVRAHLKYETMAFKTKNDPKFRKQRAEYNKKRRAILMEDPEYHAKEKIRKKKLRAKQYLKWGANPPSDTPEQALWNDFVNAAKKNDRLSLKTKLPKKRPRKVMDEIILIDNVTDKEITFGKDGKNLKNYLNTHKESFGITGADESLKPYRQKFFINDEPYLKHNINMALLGEKKGSLTAIQIQHDAGMAKNPAKVSLAFWDDNIKEHYARAEFDKAWDNAYEIKDGKKKLSYSKAKEAFNIFKTDLEKLNITSMPKMVDRFRTYGKGLGLEQALKIAKEKGAIVPSETLKKAKSFSNTLEKTMPTDLGPRSIAQLSKIHGCGKKAEGGSIMSCLQGKFKADPEKFLQKSAPLAKGNPNLRKWFKTGRNIARGTGVALAWEAALAPVIAGWGKLEGDSDQRILHDLVYGPILEGVGVPPEYVPGINPKEEFMKYAGGDELAYKMKRMGELEEQELPYLESQRDDVINKMANVEGKSFHQRTIEDDIKEKELELQALYNTPEFYEGPAGGQSPQGDYGYNEPVIQGAFDLEQQTTAKIAADTAERKKATFDWLRENKLIADKNWQSQVSYAQGGIASLKKKW